MNGSSLKTCGLRKKNYNIYDSNKHFWAKILQEKKKNICKLRKIYAKSCFIISRLKAAARLYVSGNQLNKIAPEYLKVLLPGLSLSLEG